jgi:hypothetical protein
MWKKIMLRRPRDSPDKVSASEGGHSSMERDNVGVGKGKAKPFVPFVSPLLVAGDNQLNYLISDTWHFVLKIKLMGLG